MTLELQFLLVLFALLLDLRFLQPENFFDVGLNGLKLLFALLALTVFGVSGVFGRRQIFDLILDSLDGTVILYGSKNTK